MNLSTQENLNNPYKLSFGDISQHYLDFSDAKENSKAGVPPKPRAGSAHHPQPFDYKQQRSKSPLTFSVAPVGIRQAASVTHLESPAKVFSEVASPKTARGEGAKFLLES